LLSTMFFSTDADPLAECLAEKERLSLAFATCQVNLTLCQGENLVAAGHLQLWMGLALGAFVGVLLCQVLCLVRAFWHCTRYPRLFPLDR
jgi:hypothetical protein